MPRSNVDFWRAKIARNIARDYVNNVDLELAGWKVIRVWECEIRAVRGRQEYLEKLYEKIVGPFSKPIPYSIPEEEDYVVAAEPEGNG